MSSKLAQFLHQDRFEAAKIVMNIQDVRSSIDELVCLLFPQRGCLGARDLVSTEKIVTSLQMKFKSFFDSVVALDPNLKTKSQEKSEAFFNRLPAIAKMLDQDADASFQGDPAARSHEEVITTYPGFYAVSVYRLAHAVHQLEIPLIPRLMSEYAHEKTGIDIHPGAQIGERFFIDHGTGVVIGETSIIGKNVKIYQGVTLGALSVKKKLQNLKRHPTIEDDVIIYANSTILGGDTIIGQGSVIGGNVWLTQSMPNGSVVFNKLETGHTLPGSSNGNSPI